MFTTSFKIKTHRWLCHWCIILFCLFSFSVQAQDVSISGKVTSIEAGEELPGVNVIVKGTTNGTVTDISGNYQLNVPANSTLVFSYVGFLSQEIAVGNQRVLDVQLELDVQSLSEVVVVGYGVQKKSDVTGSIVSVDEKALREIPAAGLSNALQGRMAGVEFQKTSSKPGAPMQIRIRGNRSLGSPTDGNNDPLIVVDGIPYGGNLTDISPNDIVSVDVLKDASATAIYGSRGSNGVIIVSTRKGKAGKARLTYNAFQGVTTILGKYELFNGEEYAAFKRVSRFGGATDAEQFTPTELASLAEGVETDWQDEMYRNGIMSSHEIGVSGGTEETTYSMSASYFNETTVLPGQGFKRYSLRTTLDQQIGERIKIGINSLNTLTYRKGEGINPMFSILTLSPLYKAYDDNGEIIETPAIGAIDGNTISPLVLDDQSRWDQTRRRLRTFNSLYGEIEIIDGLKYRANIGLDYWQDEFGQFNGRQTPMSNGTGNTANIRNEDEWSYTVENLLLYEKEFGEHRLNFTGLFSVQELENNRSRIDAQNVFADQILYYDFQLADAFSLGGNDPFNYFRWGLVSYMARINYAFSDKYALTLTGRRDGSSRLAEGNKWFTYPAAAAAWNIHNEDFLSGVPVISNLKLKLGWGRTSNQAINPYSSLGSLERVTYNWGPGQPATGFRVSNLPNTNLSWEFTTTTNLGLELGLFTNRVVLNVDLYNSRTTDILQNRELAITSGINGSYRQNIGEVENKGVEVVLNTVNFESADPNGFNWTMDVNFFLNREKIVKLVDTVQQNIGNGWFVGHPFDVIYTYEKIGIWQLGEEEEADAAGSIYSPGVIKVKDQNGDTVINDEDRKIIGYLQPKWQGGMTHRFSMFGVDLSIVTFARVGGKLVSALYEARAGYPVNNLEGRRNGPRVDYWTLDNPTNEFPAPGLQEPQHGNTLGIFDGTYVKIRSINLGYTIPSSLTDRLGISSLRVYATINNPMKAFFSDYVKAGGLDPEPTGRGNTGLPGFGQRLTVQPDTPVTRSYLFGVNLSF